MQQQTPLAATWSQVTELLEAGYSLIPVRDKAEQTRSGKIKPAKSPYDYWTEFQTRIITAGELWVQMEKYDTTAIAMLGGKISGNVEIIDIDVKWKPGIDAMLFKNIQELYPDLWNRLRLHRSPSGGFHIPYRIIDQPPPPSQKLAKRLTTATEQATSSTKQVAFIETRGEGGYALVPPSMGYSVYKAQPMPLLTWAERCALVGLCTTYNEVIKVAPAPKVTRKEDEYYDVNPFADFNKRSGEDVLLEFGWTRNGQSAEFAWFTRPGSKSGERHGSYIKSKGVFFFWSTNTEFESEKCYQPSTIYTTLKHNGDYKLAYKDLVARGYGKIKQAKEDRLVRLARVAPANLSLEAREMFDRRVRERSAAHPFGVYWEVSAEGDRCTIDREALYTVSRELGYFLYKDEIVKLVSPGFLHKVTERTFFDGVKAYIKEGDADLYQLIVNTYEHFIQVAGTFTISRLHLLDESRLLLDTHNTCYKFYTDKYIRITKDTVDEFGYDELDGYVFAERLLNRPYTNAVGGRYLDFLNKAVEYELHKEHILRVIGYLAHEYKDENTAYIIVLTEQCPDPRQGGGSGKNLFCNLFKNITTVSGRPGEQINYDEKFFQAWRGQRLFVISDAPKDFNFLFLKELSSGEAILKNLFKDQRVLLVDELPKLIINTNYSYEITDGGLKRRIIPIEFTDFFTRNNGVRMFYGGVHFSRDWDEQDWAGYDHIMIAGIQAWLTSNLILTPPVLTVGGWRKQFEQTYGHYAAEFIYDNFIAWTELGFVPNVEFKKQLLDYCDEKGINKIYQPSIHKVNKAVEEYAMRMQIEHKPDAQKKINGMNIKGKIFINTEEAPF